MEPWIISLLCIVLMLFLVFSGVYIACGLIIAGALGILCIGGTQVFAGQLSVVGFGSTSVYGYVVLPLFVLMGQFAAEAGLGEDAFRAARLWIGHLRGGLAMATVAGCGAFGAASGSTASAAALFGRIAFPDMVKFGYNKSLAAGCIAAAGTVAGMIPPSGLLVLFGIIAEQPIGKLLIGGVGPGLLEIFSYSVVIYLLARINPKLAPVIRENVSWRARVISLKSVLPLGIIFMFAIGGIFFGLFTPSEGGAMGAGGALLVSLLMRRLSLKTITYSLKESCTITGMVFMAILGGFVFSRMLVLGGVIEALSSFVVSLPISRHLIFSIITVLYIILGMTMQSIVIMVITVPVLLPAIMALGYNPIWFGVMFARLSEMAVITPPVAVNLYVLKGILRDQVTLSEIIRGTLWFLFADVTNLFLLYLFPQITLWLPSLMWE